MNADNCRIAKRAITNMGHARKSSWVLLGDKQSLGAMCIDCGLSVVIDAQGFATGHALQTQCSKKFGQR